MPSNENGHLGISLLWERFRNSENPININTKIKSESDERYAEAVHFHDFPQLWYCLDGHYTHTVDDITYDCGPGSLIIVPSGATHSFVIPQEKACRVVQSNISFNLFDDFADDNELLAATHIFLINFARELKFTPRIHISFAGEEKELTDSIFIKLAAFDWSQHISNFQKQKKLFVKIFSQSAFELSQKHLSRARYFIEKKYIPLLRTIYFMNLNYSRKIYKEELIELSGICQTDYFRYIKRILGCSFSTYLQRIRVRHAIVLSSFSRYSLSYIADICGFGDLTYMENRIKKYNNGQCLPSDMRKERNKYIATFPFMVMSRNDYKKLPYFLYSYGLEKYNQNTF